MHRASRLLWSCAVALSAAACVVESPATSEATSELVCTGFGCNGNSPTIAGAPFYEINLDGLPNSQGVKLVSFHSASGQPFALDVRGARLVGLDTAGNIALDTPGMTNAIINVSDHRGRAWRIRVVEMENIDYWAPPIVPATAYHLMIGTNPSDEQELCAHAADRAVWPMGNLRYAVTFKPDRYDPATGLVMTPSSRWANISCAGSLPAKMLLRRYTEASANPVLPTNRVEQQSLANAFASKICRTAPGLTGDGETLHIADAKLRPGPINWNNIEGLWGPQGAICLGEHRLVHATSMPQADADLLWPQIPALCPGIPSCSSIPDLPTKWKLYGHVLTSNP